MKTGKYWTGIADVTSEDLPENVKGALYRVLTFAEDYEDFTQKVSDVLQNSGDNLVIIEEACLLSEFLSSKWIESDHEIYEMMETAEKNKQDVVCGEAEYYSFDDA